MTPPIEKLTSDGYDLQWGTNALGYASISLGARARPDTFALRRHYFFTRQLLPLLRAGVASAPQGSVRVVHTASIAADTGNGKINFATLRGASPARTKLGISNLYSQSKLANILLSNAFARRYGDDGIVFVSVNPGVVHTELQRNFSSFGAFVVVRASSLQLVDQPWVLTPHIEKADAPGKLRCAYAALGRHVARGPEYEWQARVAVGAGGQGAQDRGRRAAPRAGLRVVRGSGQEYLVDSKFGKNGRTV
jgi:retinol dehydrogenase-12